MLEALTTAMMHSSAPMVLSDPHLPDMPMIVVNQAFVELSGYPREALIGRNCRFLQGPKTDPTAAPRIRACLQAGQGCIEWIVNYRRDGSTFWNLLFISPVRAADGTLLYYFGNQHDVTYGFPTWLPEVGFGPAQVAPALEQEFHALVAEVDEAGRAQALGRITAAARRIAEISVQLAPGTLG
jgi:PAS domain S-box-containing protein